MRCGAVVIGSSAGGFLALEAILGVLDATFAAPILLVQHLHTSDRGLFAEHLGRVSPLRVVEVGDKHVVAPAFVHVAPAGYHLLVEDASTLALSVDPPVHHSRPAIDPLFESAARVWGTELIGVLLSGASNDGTQGLRAVKAAGGRCLVQDPASAESARMPRCAIEAGFGDEVLAPARIGVRLRELCCGVGV